MWNVKLENFREENNKKYWKLKLGREFLDLIHKRKNGKLWLINKMKTTDWD